MLALIATDVQNIFRTELSPQVNSFDRKVPTEIVAVSLLRRRQLSIFTKLDN